MQRECLCKNRVAEPVHTHHGRIPCSPECKNWNREWQLAWQRRWGGFKRVQACWGGRLISYSKEQKAVTFAKDKEQGCLLRVSPFESQLKKKKTKGFFMPAPEGKPELLIRSVVEFQAGLSVLLR